VEGSEFFLLDKCSRKFHLQEWPNKKLEGIEQGRRPPIACTEAKLQSIMRKENGKIGDNRDKREGYVDGI
jgi:hypothetical protein